MARIPLSVRTDLLSLFTINEVESLEINVLIDCLVSPVVFHAMSGTPVHNIEF